MKWADYCISKITKEKNILSSALVHVDKDSTVGPGELKRRSWIIDEIKKGKSFCCIGRTVEGLWTNLGYFKYSNYKLNWAKILPEALPKRKAFVSFYHKDDEKHRRRFDNLFGDLVISKSVNDGDIDSDNSDSYIKQLIQNGCLEDTTILVVLIGPNTKHRKHVDWEISGALNYKVGDAYAGLLGLKIPGHPDYGTGKHNKNLLPARFSDNLKTGYAIIRDWTDDRAQLQSYLELAFAQRGSGKRDNSRIQMKINTC